MFILVPFPVFLLFFFERRLETSLGRRDRRDIDLCMLLPFISVIATSAVDSIADTNTARAANTLKHARAASRHVDQFGHGRARGRKHAVNAGREDQRTGAAVLELERHVQDAADAHEAETNVRVVCERGRQAVPPHAQMQANKSGMHKRMMSKTVSTIS